MIRYLSTPIGTLRVESDGPVVAIHFDDRSAGERCDDDAVVRQLHEYFVGDRESFDFDANPQGTEFQRKVWDEVARIPYGETRTYRDIAEALGDPNLVRAVGAANGANPLPIVIPCHRVIGADGRLTGYAGGLERKRWLLAHESPQGELEF